jgi:hypothetical protein
MAPDEELGVAGPAPAPTAPPTIVAIVHVTTVDHVLVDALLGIAEQTRKPDVVRILDATPAGDLEERLAGNVGLADDLPGLSVRRIAPGTRLRDAVMASLTDPAAPGPVPGADRGAADPSESAQPGDTSIPDASIPDSSMPDALWVLTGRTCPEPEALTILIAALFGTRDGALAAPKLMDWDRPGRLQRFGIQSTRAGRLRLRPRAGEPDQQQYDDRLDALAAPVPGALVRVDAFRDLGGFDKSFDGLGADLDLGWRAHRSGRHIVLAPRARVRIADPFAHPTAVADRRAARRVALTRCPLLLAPFLALWIALGAIAAGTLLLLLKRPRGAAREFADLTCLADPVRGIPARWRARRLRRGDRHSLQGLFVPSSVVAKQALDRLHDLVIPSGRVAADPGSDTAAGADPETEDAMAAAPEHAQAVRNPGLWAVIAAAVVAVVAGRTLPSGLAGGVRDGFSGGELTGARASAGALWHSWIDGWRGPGLGTADPGSSGLPVLAGLVWLWDHIPFHDAGANPLGGLLGVALLLACPLAAWSAYVAGRVLTRRRWARALAALAWACSPVAAAGVGEGRIGILALLVLLPLVLGGLAALTTSTRAGTTVAAALPAILLATVVPGILVVTTLLALGMAIAGSGRTARRAGGYLLAIAVGAAPVLREVLENPLRLLTGWGLLGVPDTRPTPEQLALLHPAAGHAVAVLLTAPMVALGLLALIRRSAPAGPTWMAAALIVLGIAAAVILPRVWIRQGREVVAGWAGLGLILALAGLLIAGLHASDADLRRDCAGCPPSRASWPSAVWSPASS